MHSPSPHATDLEGGRILLSGASGYIARQLLPVLLERGAVVLAQTRFPDSLQAESSEALTVVAGSLDDPEVIASIQEFAPEIAFGLGGRTDASFSEENREAMQEEHIDYAQALAAVLQAAPLRRLVYAGSCAEYGNSGAPFDEAQEVFPNDPYATAKHAAVNLMRRKAQDGLPVCIVRPFVVYGPNQNRGLVHFVLQKALADEAFDTTEGSQTRDLIWIGDLISGLLAAATAPTVDGEVINLGSGQEISVRAVIERICELAGGGKPNFGAVELRPGEVVRSVAKVEKARTLLDWRAEVSLDEGLRRMVEAARAEQSE